MTPDLARVAAVSSRGVISIWDAESGEELLVLDEAVSGIADIVFGPEGRLLAAIDDDGVFRMWGPRWPAPGP